MTMVKVMQTTAKPANRAVLERSKREERNPCCFFFMTEIAYIKSFGNETALIYPWQMVPSDA